MTWYMFIEEAYLTFSSGKEARYDLGDGPDIGFLRSARKIAGDTSVILTDQVPSKLHQSVTANCENFIVFRLVKNKDVAEAASCLGLEPYQRKEISELGEREVIVRVKRYSRPLKLMIPELSFPQAPSQEEARELSRPFLDEIPFVKASVKDEDVSLSTKRDTTDEAGGGEGTLPPITRRVYARIAEKPWEIIEDRMDALGLDRESENAARRKLEALGLIEFCGRVGSKNKLFRLTKRGRKVAEQWA